MDTQIIPATVRFDRLRAFLVTEAAKGNNTALHLLREMRGKPGGVKA